MTERAYAGEELDLFARAENWKRYLVAEVTPFLGRRVLEVGAGIGATTRAFKGHARASWVCLEPDPDNARRLTEMASRGELPSSCVVRGGTAGDLDAADSYDTILYIDVLEHIEDDAAELRLAAAHLAVGGHVVVVSPAHPWLFSPFDAAIGHHRRYTKQRLCDVAPAGVELVRRRYLDSVGLAASGANRVLLRRATPRLREILVWDRLMVPASRWLDPLLGHAVGKSVLTVWRRRS